MTVSLLLNVAYASVAWLHQCWNIRQDMGLDLEGMLLITKYILRNGI